MNDNNKIQKYMEVEITSINWTFTKDSYLQCGGGKL